MIVLKTLLDSNASLKAMQATRACAAPRPSATVGWNLTQGSIDLSFSLWSRCVGCSRPSSVIEF